MAEKWNTELDSLYGKIEKDIGYDNACSLIKEKECAFSTRHLVNDIINSCSGALKEQLEGRLIILNSFYNDGDFISVKREVQIGDLNIDVEAGYGNGWFSTVKFTPPASSGRGIFAYTCDFGSGQDTGREWKAQDFLDIMKIGGLYEVPIKEFLLYRTFRS